MQNYFVNHYGQEKQIDKLKEETLELAEAIKGYREGKDNLAHVKEEMADVLNLIDQLNNHFNDGEISKIVHKKRTRQMERIRKEIEITCPQCGISYKVEKLEEHAVICQDCGRQYHQKTMAKVKDAFIRDRLQGK